MVVCRSYSWAKAAGANGSDSELLESDLIVFGVVVPGSVSVVACPFDVVEEPAEWFPPNGFEGDPFLVDVLVLSVEIVVCNLDPSLRKVTVGNGSSFNRLSGESAFVGREMMKSVLLYVIGRELRAHGAVWRRVEGGREWPWVGNPLRVSFSCSWIMMAFGARVLMGSRAQRISSSSFLS